MEKEFEYKFMVQKNEFYHIESYMFTSKIPYKIVTQTNYYYDTNDFLLYNSGMTCRIRRIDSKLLGTLKIHCNKHVNSNIELPLNVNEITETLCLDKLCLTLIGELVTIRKSFELNNGIQIMLDTNIYRGNTDFEIEVEYPENAIEQAKRIMDELDMLLYQHGIMTGQDMSSVYDKSSSKYSRFIKATGKIHNKNNVLITDKGDTNESC